jgi:hypothetical protein
MLKSAIMTNLDNGGRGIGNIVESYLVNPLSSYIFDLDVNSGDSILIDDIKDNDGRKELVVLTNDSNIQNCEEDLRRDSLNQNDSNIFDTESKQMMQNEKKNDDIVDDSIQSIDDFFEKIPSSSKFNNDGEIKNIDDFFKN